MGVKAQSAIILQKAGRTAEANEFIASIKEHLVQTDERGAYFAFYERPFLWGTQPISVHVEVMEALRMAGGNDALVEEMKLWLLKQKQTTSWNSPVATADAIYALLCQGSDLVGHHVVMYALFLAVKCWKHSHLPRPQFPDWDISRKALQKVVLNCVPSPLLWKRGMQALPGGQSMHNICRLFPM